MKKAQNSDDEEKVEKNRFRNGQTAEICKQKKK